MPEHRHRPLRLSLQVAVERLGGFEIDRELFGPMIQGGVHLAALAAAGASGDAGEEGDLGDAVLDAEAGMDRRIGEDPAENRGIVEDEVALEVDQAAFLLLPVVALDAGTGVGEGLRRRRRGR